MIHANVDLQMLLALLDSEMESEVGLQSHFFTFSKFSWLCAMSILNSNTIRSILQVPWDFKKLIGIQLSGTWKEAWRQEMGQIFIFVFITCDYIIHLSLYIY